MQDYYGESEADLAQHGDSPTSTREAVEVGSHGSGQPVGSEESGRQIRTPYSMGEQSWSRNERPTDERREAARQHLLTVQSRLDLTTSDGQGPESQQSRDTTRPAPPNKLEEVLYGEVNGYPLAEQLLTDLQPNPEDTPEEKQRNELAARQAIRGIFESRMRERFREQILEENTELRSRQQELMEAMQGNISAEDMARSSQELLALNTQIKEAIDQTLQQETIQKRIDELVTRFMKGEDTDEMILRFFNLVQPDQDVTDFRPELMTDETLRALQTEKNKVVVFIKRLGLDTGEWLTEANTLNDLSMLLQAMMGSGSGRVGGGAEFGKNGEEIDYEGWLQLLEDQDADSFSKLLTEILRGTTSDAANAPRLGLELVNNNPGIERNIYAQLEQVELVRGTAEQAWHVVVTHLAEQDQNDDQLAKKLQQLFSRLGPAMLDSGMIEREFKMRQGFAREARDAVTVQK